MGCQYGWTPATLCFSGLLYLELEGLPLLGYRILYLEEGQGKILESPQATLSGKLHFGEFNWA